LRAENSVASSWQSDRAAPRLALAGSFLFEILLLDALVVAPLYNVWLLCATKDSLGEKAI
jgi:hypothetical protein